MGKYIVVKSFKTPIVIDTRNPRNPTEVKYKFYKRGEIIDGSLKLDANGKPEFVLSNKKLVVPLEAVRELVVREIKSSADGVSVDANGVKTITKEDAKINYIDNSIIGGLSGLAIVYLAQKKGWLVEPTESKIPHQNKLIGLVVGAFAGAYYTFRKASKQKINIKK